MKHNPQRRCVGCREMKDKPSLVRVANHAGEISPDTGGKSPGRGAYVCTSTECLKKARKSKGLERSFKRAVPSNIYGQLSELIAEQERLGG